MQGFEPLLQPLRAARPGLWPLALALLFTYGYFIETPAWNQNSRFALTRAVVEDGAVTIDRFHSSTGDKSYYQGHYYSDKAPGMSFLAVPAYAVFYGAKRLVHGELPDTHVLPLDPLDAAARRVPDPEQRAAGDRVVYNQAHRIALYLCTLTTSVLFGLAGATAFYLLAFHQLGHAGRAAVATAAYALATPCFVYSTAFYGHQASAASLLVAFALVALVERRSPPSPAVALAAGSSLGVSVVCEYPAAAATLIILAFAVARLGGRFALWMILGGAPWALFLGLYHWSAFGSPWATGYDYVALEVFATGMRDAYGLGLPRPEVLLELLFGSYRGLFYLSPILLLAPWGLAAGLFHARRIPGSLERPATATALAIVIYYLGLNSGYYMWDGGAAFGPRHLVPMIPFLALGLAVPLRAVPLAWWILAAVSTMHMLVGAAATPEAPQYGDPLWQFAWPKMIAAGGSEDLGATNVGRVLGLPGAASLLPLLLLWVWTIPLARDGFKTATIRPHPPSTGRRTKEPS